MGNVSAKYLLIMVMGVFNYLSVGAQQFWLTTNEFWGGPKTRIALVNDSVFFVSTTNSVLRSTDEFNQLELVLVSSGIHTLFISENGKIFAGGTGKIFFSDDLGLNWDSVTINTTYPLKQFVENTNGDLFAVTGVIDEGDGVFFSGDKGLNWEKRNYGLGGYLGCDKVAIDKNNRLYLATSDEAVTGSGGLYISENNGVQWQKIAIVIDSINTSARIGSTTNLTVLPNDSIYFSFWGSGENFGIELNIYKSVHNVNKSNLWKILDVKHSPIAGMDNAMNNLYIMRNRDWYSSFTESGNKGGTYYLKDGKNWKVLNYGLGVDQNGLKNEQYFAETSNGRIFMIQYMDERIYKTDTSVVTNAPNPIEVNLNINIYPNPVRKGENFTLKMDQNYDSAEISIYDISGKKLFYTQPYNTLTNIPAPWNEGTYIVYVRKDYLGKALKIVVN